MRSPVSEGEAEMETRKGDYDKFSAVQCKVEEKSSFALVWFASAEGKRKGKKIN